MAISVGIRMTKQIFADSVASVIPVVGGALSGGLDICNVQAWLHETKKEFNVL